MEKNHFVSVAGLVTDETGRVLLVKSPRRGWEFPGGMVEPGETLTTALIREIKEESGVDAEIVGFVGICKNIQKDTVNIDFRCRYVGGELQTSDESVDVKWVMPDEAREMVTFPLYKKRLGNMLAYDGKAHFFGFTREPFEISDEIDI